MEDLRSDLMLLGAGRSPRRWRRLERWLKVTLRMAVVVTGVALVSIGLGVWANLERLRALAAERELSARFVEQQLFLARATRLAGVPGQRTRALSIIQEAARKTNSLELRNEAVAALGLPDVSHSRTIRGAWMVFDNLVRRYATNDAGGNIFVRSVEDDRLLACLATDGVPASEPAPTGLAALDFSALGDYFCATYSNRLVLVWPIAISPSGPDGPKRRDPGGNDPERAFPLRVTLSSQPRRLYMVPGGHLAAIQSDSGALHVVDLAAGRQVRLIEGPFTNSIAFSRDGTRFASIRKDSFAVRDLETGVELQSFTNRTTGFDNLVWHPDGRQIVTMSGGRDLRLWNLETGAQSGVLRGHEAEVIDAVYDSSAQWLLTSSWDNQTVLWNVARQKAVLQMAGAGNGMHFSSDARRIAWHRWDDRQWEIFDMTPPSEVTWLEQHPRQEAPTGLRSLWGAVFLDADVVAGEGNAGFSVWLPPASYAQTLAPTGLERPLFAIPGRSLYSSGENGVRRWSINVDAEHGEIHVGPPERLSPVKLGATREFSVSHDGRQIVFAANRHLFLLTEKAPSGCRELDTDGVRAVAIAPVGGFVAASLRDGGVRIWDAGTGTVTTNLPCPPAWTCKVSPDGRWLSAGTPESFLIWRVADWRLVHQIRRTAVSVAAQAWLPDSEVFVAHDVDSTVCLVRAATWEQLASLPAPEMLRDICPSPDGARLALAGEKAGIEMWDLRRLRRRLGELGLDWTGPPVLTAQEPSASKRWNLRVDLGPE